MSDYANYHVFGFNPGNLNQNKHLIKKRRE